ncbi:RHS repeat-associated core domain-containing protein, partial [Fangia hongkongensis]|nr:RHS repeat-associated core domain-containing protein [Fangia hongkongensis]
IKAVGEHLDILEMPRLEFKSMLSKATEDFIHQQLAISGRTMDDLRADNVGYLNGNPVITDVDRVVLKNRRGSIYSEALYIEEHPPLSMVESNSSPLNNLGFGMSARSLLLENSGEYQFKGFGEGRW